MKKIIIIAVAVIMTACSSESQNSYSIKGIITDPELNVTTLYLRDHNTDTYIDTANVVGGMYEFKGVADNVKYARIEAPGSPYSANVVLESGDITIESEKPYKAMGTELNNKLYVFKQNETMAMEQLRTKMRDIQHNSQLNNEQKDKVIGETFAEYSKNKEKVTLEMLSENEDNIIASIMVMNMYSTYRNDMAKFDSLYNTLSDEFKDFGPLKLVIEIAKQQQEQQQEQ